MKTTFKDDIAKMLFEVGRLIFGGIVINEILRRQLRWVDEDISHDLLFLVGIAVVAVCFILSLILGVREIKTDKSPSNRDDAAKRLKKRRKR